MTITLNGTTGIQNVLGSAAAPAESNTSSSNTGLYFPTSTTVGISTAGTNAVTIDTNQRVAFVAGTAALPAITTNGDTNTGIFFPAADTIAFAEGGAEAMRIDSSANLQFNSGYGSVTTAYGCRAWVNFNGTGTVAIRASGNVDHITDNGTGDYTVTFITAMPDANYSFVNQIDWVNPAFGASGRASCIVSLTTTTAQMRTGFLNGTAVFTAEDEAIICVSIFR